VQAFLVALGVLSLEQAYAAVDFDTTLLLGMMIVVAHLRLSRIFALINSRGMRYAHRPLNPSS